jgi:nucleotide-binding universal stress UspA family protein
MAIDLGQQVLRHDHVDPDARPIHRRRRDEGDDAVAIGGIGHDRFER